jgi:WD40 repeat protein
VNDIAYNVDTNRLISSGEDQFVRIWNLTNRAEIVHFGKFHDVRASVALSPDGYRALFHTTDGTIHLADLPAPLPWSASGQWSGHRQAVDGLDYLPHKADGLAEPR